MTTETLQEYAKLLISMSTDFLLGSIDEDHYKNMINTLNRDINPKGDSPNV